MKMVIVMLQYKLKIKELRETIGITQTDLATRIGISKSYLCELENNKYDIKLSLLLKIAEVLKVNIENLYEKK